MAAFSVDPAALLAVIDRMTAFDSELEAQLAQAANSVARLGTSWYGDGGEAERAAQARWDEGAREMRRHWPDYARSPRARTKTIPRRCRRTCACGVDV